MIRTSIAFAALLGIGAIIVLEPDSEARLLVTAMTILAWMFALSYAVRSQWRATGIGRSVMATTVCLALLGSQLMSRWWFGAYPWHNEVRAVIVLALTLTILHRLLVLWRIQREERPVERREDAR